MPWARMSSRFSFSLNWIACRASVLAQPQGTLLEHAPLDPVHLPEGAGDTRPTLHALLIPRPCAWNKRPLQLQESFEVVLQRAPQELIQLRKRPMWPHRIDWTKRTLCCLFAFQDTCHVICSLVPGKKGGYMPIRRCVTGLPRRSKHRPLLPPHPTPPAVAEHWQSVYCVRSIRLCAICCKERVSWLRSKNVRGCPGRQLGRWRQEPCGLTRSINSGISWGYHAWGQFSSELFSV